MPLDRPEDLQIDQIPVGLGYGVERAEINRPPLVASNLAPPGILDPLPEFEWWLIRFNEREERWERVERLPWDAVVSFTFRGQRYVYDRQHRP